MGAWLKRPFSDENYPIAENLASVKSIDFPIRGGVGMDNIDAEYASSKGIILRNTPKASVIAVAELAFGRVKKSYKFLMHT